MSKVLVNESSLTSIGNAIREKNGLTNKYKPSEMATAILNITTGGTGGGLPEGALTITGDCQYKFYNNGWNWFIDDYGNQITTKDITHANYMFCTCQQLNEIPFEINFKPSTGYNYHMVNNMFDSCNKITSIPKMSNCRPDATKNLFSNCYNLRYLPEDLDSYFDWEYIEVTNANSAYSGGRGNMFYACYSLRSIPMNFLNHGNPNCNNSNSIYYYGFNLCCALDEIVGLPIPHAKSTDSTTWTSNAFSYTFDSCYRLKNMTFALQEDGTPYTVKWKNQVIDLSKNVGYTAYSNNIINYNSGLTTATEINNSVTYQNNKDNPDSWATNISFSRYNHDSAVATINSLPDASATGTNTIKFKGESGELTDGGAINTLTEEEIAVATAKGWTVSLV